MKIINSIKNDKLEKFPRNGPSPIKSGRRAVSSLGKHRMQPILDVFSNTGILGAEDSRPMIKGTRMFLHE